VAFSSVKSNIVETDHHQPVQYETYKTLATDTKGFKAAIHAPML